MDISTAERSIKKLLSYVESVDTSQSTLYDKSKQRLQSIADDCTQVIEIISEILQTELLNNDDTEFASSNTDITEQVTQMCTELDTVKDFLSIPKLPNLPPHDTKLSSADMKKVIATYKIGLKGLATNTYSEYEYINECTSLMWKWFEQRIIVQHPASPRFKYNIFRIRDILYSIVIAFGYHIEHNDIDKFINSFEKWIQELNNSPDSNKWIAPFEVYDIERHLHTDELKYANLTAVIIWDILMDIGLDVLCSGKSSPMLYKTSIWDITDEVNSELLDDYFCYSDISPGEISMLDNLHRKESTA